MTAIPRWTLHPVPGAASYEAAIPADLSAALGRLARELGVPLSSVLLAAHAKVLAVLSGEQQVTAGYATGPSGPVLPCRLAAGPGSWRALLLTASQSEAALLAREDFPVAALGRELDLTGPRFETVLDPSGRDIELTGDIVLRAGIRRRDGGLVLRLRYRTDVLDTASATRIAGYHLTALTLTAADPDADHERQTLLSEGERRFQLERLAGPRRDLPDLPAHQLFERQAAAYPEAIAVTHGDRAWTYAELNARANRLGRALLARGLRREEAVAVVTERNLDWTAAVLAVFKAGGVYLPIEPRFPPGRIAATLSRAGCRLVLTESGSTATLQAALGTLPGSQLLFTDTAYAEQSADGDLGVPVTPGQLAYIYFTSGSTGEPKGAMCEHAGMLNHLFAKIADLEIGQGTVVAQTAPQCFDISMWQLISALLTGGRTLLIEQEVILDARRFIDKIADGQVTVLQVVPSYLEAILSYLEQHPRELPHLRYVSATGEALKTEIAQRWFAAQPQIKLVNAYGLTETSDDTNHEIMDRSPEDGPIPLGRPVSNVHAYVVDEHLALVPLGAPGAIVFSGICVGRGYVNDPERTRKAFTPDPHRPGQRLYHAGDYGRWRPDGKLEYLGRRDSQVKINGFRIEIGEIENALLRAPKIRDGAVVVTQRAGQAGQLVAFYTSPHPLQTDALRDHLAESLPAYMIPSAFHWRQTLPLTANSKIDRKTLSALAGDTGAGQENHDAPRTPTQRRLAVAWAKTLGIPQDQIGRRDNFFARGGTSLSAVKLAVTLDRAVTLKDLTSHPVLADLADLIDGKSQRLPGLLQLLSEPDDAPAGVLVCFPYAGGNAVNFQPMASALRGSGLAVYAVELPGHDLAADSGSFAPMPQVVDRVTAEITGRGLTRILLWGHSSGAAFALATARKLEEHGVDLERVFVAGQLAGDAATRRAAMTRLAEPADAYRHDLLCAHRFLADALDAPAAVRLTTPLTVVVAADDEITAGYARHWRDWQLLADRVDLHELADGGHYFLRTRPAETARALRHAAGLPASR
ncbi:MAG TPA: amino acid adenylation domain-containing protein [Trebonia sp.]|jgi:amino acid adenylation domain-containing protein|nr:amino acid adenylation domain-containing protein [Trebonia sp.]